MQIPTGSDKFGGRMPQIKQTSVGNPNSVNGSSASIFDGASKLLGSALDKVNAEQLANDKLDAENNLFQYQAQLDDVNNQVADLYATGQIDYEKMPEKHEELKNKLDVPYFSHLDKTNQKSFILQRDKLDHVNKLDMVNKFNSARQNRAKASVESYAGNAQAVVQSDNANVAETKQSLANNKDFQEEGRFSYGDEWDFREQSIYQQLESSYVQRQIEIASNSEDINELKYVKNILHDDQQIAYLTPLVKNQFTKKIDSLIDINVGRSYGKTLVNNCNQLVEKMGDFSAINAYETLRKSLAANQQIGSAETVKMMANKLGVNFDAQRFKDNPPYLKQLQQDYFNQALDEYGSLAMAAIAIQVGDKQINRWFKQFGDPSKDQLSEEAFINLIPDERVKQIAHVINTQAERDESDLINIDDTLQAIDTDSSLNDNQKHYAKAQFRQYAEGIQKQLQGAYRESHQSLWRDIYINKIPLGDIDPERIKALKSSDQLVLLSTPKQTIDMSVYSEARGRLKAGNEFNVLKDYADKLPVNELDQLLTLQQNLTEDVDKKNYLSITTALIADRSKLLGITNKQVLNRLNDYVTDEIDDFEVYKGRKATRQEKLDIADKHVLKTKLDGQFIRGKNKTLSVIEHADHGFRKVPDKARQYISTELEQIGLPVTEENILKVFKGVKDGD